MRKPSWPNPALVPLDGFGTPSMVLSVPKPSRAGVRDRGVRHMGERKRENRWVTNENRYGPAFQRNALLPGIIAAAGLIFSQLVMRGEWDSGFTYFVSIFALIVAWFAVQAKHWWWVPVFAGVAIAWNPVYPFEFEGDLWVGAHYVVAALFLVAGILIKTPRQD